MAWSKGQEIIIISKNRVLTCFTVFFLALLSERIISTITWKEKDRVNANLNIISFDGGRILGA